MSELTRLDIPTEIYEAGHDRLSAQLEKLARKISKGKTGKIQGLRQGTEFIEEGYRTQLDKFNAYVKRKNLTGVEGTEQLLVDAKDEAIRAWNAIVGDL